MSTPSFQVLRISSCSDVPIRNNAKELIFGNHVLWEGKNTPVEDGGSLAPNVFSYDFASPLASNSTLNITLSVTNKELYGKNLVLRGTLASHSKIFESAAFTTNKADEITVPVCIVDPEPNPNPVTLNGEFTWIIVPKEQDRSGDKVIEYTSLDKTPLELYWISPNIHEIFYAGHSGIAVNFLRAARDSFGDWKAVGDNLNDGKKVTDSVFKDYSKTYDTAGGASHFGVSLTGGYFQYQRYIEGSPPGSAYRIVNCYDQAAMVQVLGTISDIRLTWLYQDPFGYINSTNLVGVPGICNNPFFEMNNSPQLVTPNDPRRIGFQRHAYNGSLAIFDPHAPNDFIYDACAGPSLGKYNTQGYVNVAIDRSTTLYTGKFRPGTVEDIKQCIGVTASPPTAHAHPIPPEPDEAVEKVLSKYTTGSNPDNHVPDSLSHVHWDDLSSAVKTLFGDACEVKYHETTIGTDIAEEFWHLTGIAGFDGDVIIKVRVHTHIGQDGNLDHEHSSRVASDNLHSALIDVEMDLGPNHERLDDIWVAAPYGDYVKCALQHAPHISEGRVRFVCGNSFVEIYGGSSSAALEPVVRKLLAYTTVDAPVSLHIPHISEHFYDILDTNKGLNSPNEVKGIFASFNVRCNVDDLITTASADADGYGVLLSKHSIDKDEDKKTSTVTFTFVTRTAGVHDVNLRFNKTLNMTTSTKKIQIIVVDG